MTTKNNMHEEHAECDIEDELLIQIFPSSNDGGGYCVNVWVGDQIDPNDDEPQGGGQYTASDLKGALAMAQSELEIIIKLNNKK